MTFEEIKEQDQSYILHTYGRVDAALVKGQNARAWDVEGKEYIDFTAGIGVNALGYSDPEWAAAVADQAGKIQHLCNYYYSPENTALAQELSEASGMAKAFFCNSGAEANECAIKVARKYGEKRGAYKIVTLVNSFHGRTLTTLAATGQESFHQLFTPLTEGFEYAQAGVLAGVEKLLDGSVCAVMMEMVQGEGGVIPMEEDFVKGLAQLCKEKDVLLLIDEVQTGVGRTGTFYAYQGYGIQPDVITTAKGIAGGLPMGYPHSWNERIHLRRQPCGLCWRTGGGPPGQRPRLPPERQRERCLPQGKAGGYASSGVCPGPWHDDRRQGQGEGFPRCAGGLCQSRTFDPDRQGPGAVLAAFDHHPEGHGRGLGHLPEGIGAIRENKCAATGG